MSFNYYMVALAIGAVAIFAFVIFKKSRYSRAMVAPFPEAWRSILRSRLAFYSRLPEPLQTELETLIKHFLYTKKFVGCEGFEITDEVRLTISAEACLLILNRPSTRYQSLKWIYVFPTAFRDKHQQRDEYGVVYENHHSFLGVSWSNGRVILAWDSVVSGFKDFSDGQNVVLHEFAHQLDQEDGSADGAPLLYTKDSYKIWSQVFSREFASLVRKVEAGRNTGIDAYGATNPAEFFAVVSELYFERPSYLEEKHPELFNTLKDYYKLDPHILGSGD